ncbi:hypothetical protein V7O62_06880 [Methanolobus sp. ZRKC2]|uniref:hypothetical protein n=1 Tax=Methanolobus sp. ZRKC2 TaxID=3125783 RepID=UPI003251864D
MAEKNEKQGSNTDRSIFDQKCITCGTWMQRTVNSNRTGVRTLTYSCPECGLSYTVDE